MSVLIIMLTFICIFSMVIYHFTIITQRKKIIMLSINFIMISLIIYILLNKGLTMSFLMILMLIITIINVFVLLLYFKYNDILVAKFPDLFKPFMRK